MTEVAQDTGVEGGAELSPEEIGSLAEFEPGDEPAAEDVTGEAPQETEPAAAPVVAPPAATPAVPQEAPPIAAAAPEPVVAEAPKPAAAPAYDPKQLEKLRTDTIADFEKRFQLTPEQEDEFNTQPGKFLAKMRANMQVEIYESTYYAIANQLPRLLSTFYQNNQSAVERENTFYGKWPQLKDAIGKDAKVAEQVVQAIQFVRAQQPNATTEQVIDTVGKMVTTMLGIAPMPVALAPNPVAAPAAPGVRRVVSRKPIAPSGPAAGSSGTPKLNEWEELAGFELPDK